MTTKHFWHHRVFSSHTLSRLWNWPPWKCHPSKKPLHQQNASSQPLINQDPRNEGYVSAVLCSLHQLSAGCCVSWTFSASVFKAVIFRGPKILKDPSPWEPHHSTSPLFRNSHTSVHNTWLHRRWGLAVGQTLIKRTWGQTTTTTGYHFLIHFPFDIIHCILHGKKKGRKWTQTHQFSLGKTDINEYWT